MRAWDAARNFNTVEGPAIVGLRILEKDLKNSFPCKKAGFMGASDNISFAMRVIRQMPDDEKQMEETVRVVKYFFDKNALFRKEREGIDSAEGRDSKELVEKIVSNLKSVKLEYYSADSVNQDDRWTDGTTNFPRGIRVEILFKKEPFRIKRTIILPVML